MLLHRRICRLSSTSVEYAPLAALVTPPHPTSWIYSRLHCRVSEQPWHSSAGGNDSFRGRIFSGENRGFALATNGGRNGCLLSGRNLCLFAGAALGTWQPGKNSLAPSHTQTTRMARTIVQTVWRQNGFYRTIHLFVSTRRGQPVGRHVENVLAYFSFLQPYGIGGLFHNIRPDRIFFREKVEAVRSLVGSHGTLSDTRGNNSYHSGRDFPAFHIRILGAANFQNKSPDIADSPFREKPINSPLKKQVTT